MYKKTFKYSFLSFYDQIVVVFFCFFKFNRSERIRKLTIENFGDTEDDTVWQLFRGFIFEKDDKIRAGLFQQILEEIYHAEEFYLALKKMSGQRTPHLSFERRALYETNSPTWKLLLYCHVGEAEAEMRFSHINKFSRNGIEKEAVSKVLIDERGHVAIAYNYLLGKDISKKEIEKELKSIFWRRRKERLAFNLKRFFGFVLSIILSVIYFVMGPVVYSVCSRRLNNPQEQLQNTQNPFVEVEL